MVWASSLVLGIGAALVTLPIVLHLLMQPRPKVHEFPALKFVQKRQFKNRSRVRLRHLLLLLLRCLLILLLAAALAGPAVASRQYGQWMTVGGVGVLAIIILFALIAVFFGSERPSRSLILFLGILFVATGGWTAWGAQRLLTDGSAELIGDSASPVTALMVVDTSSRMEYRHQNETSLERAQEFALWLLEQFPPDSQVAVVSTDSDGPFFSVDTGAAGARIENLEITHGSVPIPSRVAAGLRLMDQAIHERREVYIISDMTRRSWEASQAVLAGTLRQELALDESISVFVIDVGLDDVQNFTVAPLSLSAETIPQNGGLNIETAVTRVGTADRRSVRFRLERPDPARPVVRDGRVLTPREFIERSRTVDIRQGSTVPVEFQLSERLPLGVHHGTVEIEGEDSLTVDDTRYFTIEVVPPWEVLVIHADNVSPDNLTIAIAGDEESSLYRTTVVTQRDIPDQLDQFDAVFLLDPLPGISDTTWGVFQEYVAAGHGLGIFLGANAVSGGLAHPTFQTDQASTILTGRLDRQWRRTEADLFLSPDSLTHPIFAPFRKWETAVPWNDFPVFVHWSILPDDVRGEFPTQTILRYSNSQPAIIERSIGDGTLLVMTTPITETENQASRRPWNWLFSGAPLPAWLLVRQMAGYLVQSRTDRLNLEIGEAARLKNDYHRYPESYRVFTPRTRQSPQKITATDDVLFWRFTGSPGQYRLRGAGEQSVLRGFSVNLPGGETDLTRVEPETVEAILGAGRFQLATDRSEIQRQQGTSRTGQEFYPSLLLMLAVVMAVEYMLSNRFYS